MDMAFLANAEKLTTLNLSAADFGSIKHKREIQFLIAKHFFTSFDLNDTIDDKNFDVGAHNRVITKLKASNPEAFLQVYSYKLPGIGPGEVLMYFIHDNAFLGGGSSAGLDVIFPSGEYEIKAAYITADGKYAYHFKLGGTFDVSDIVSKLRALYAKSTGEEKPSSEISVNKIRELKKRYPNEFEKIEKAYAKLTYEHYFSKHAIIFITDNDNKSLGYVSKVKNVKIDDIEIETLTSGVIKPRIKL